jgi:hypothetical protein
MCHQSPLSISTDVPLSYASLNFPFIIWQFIVMLQLKDSMIWKIVFVYRFNFEYPWKFKCSSSSLNTNSIVWFQCRRTFSMKQKSLEEILSFTKNLKMVGLFLVGKRFVQQQYKHLYNYSKNFPKKRTTRK